MPAIGVLQCVWLFTLCNFNRGFFIKLGVSDSHMQGLKEEEAAALFSRKWQR